MGEPPEIRSAFVTAIMNAIFETAASPTGEEAALNPQDVQEALTIVMAGFIVADPSAPTLTAERHEAERWGRFLRVQVKEQRRNLDENGWRIVPELRAVSVQ